MVAISTVFDCEFVSAVALESVLVGNLVPYFINYKLRIREISTAKIVNSSGTRNLLL